MNSSVKFILLIPAFFFLFISCTKDDATGITLSSQDVSLKTGLSDTLNVTVNYTGDLAKVPVTVTVSDSTITSARILAPQNETSQGHLTFSRSVVVKAKSPGTANVVIHAGSRIITCTTKNTQTSLLANQAYVTNYGLAVETSNNNVFIMNLFPQTFKVNPSGGIISGSGQFVHFELFFPATTTSLTAGTFQNNPNGGINSFLPGDYNVQNGQSVPYGTYIETIDNNQATVTLVKSGKYTISINGSTYNIEGNLTTETNEIVHFSYAGPVSVTDKTEKPEVVSPQFTKGELDYAGDYYHMGISNTFFLYLETANVDLYSNTLDGELLILQLDTYDYYANSIPSGTYNVLTQEQLDNFSVKPFTIVPGNFHLYQNQPVTGGAWYYNSTSRKRLISGSVNVTNDSQNYTLKYSFYDRIGSQVTGTYNGSFKFRSLAPVAPGTIKPAPAGVISTVGFSALSRQQAKAFGLMHEDHLRFTGVR